MIERSRHASGGTRVLRSPLFTPVTLVFLIAGSLPFAIPSAADPEPLGEEIRVNTVFDGRELKPGLASLGNGAVMVTWEGEDGDGRGIFGRRIDGLNQGLEDDLQISVTTADDQTETNVAALPGGDFLVVWEDEDGESSVVSRKYAADATPEAPVDVFPEALDVVVFDPEVVPTGDGGFVVAWYDYDYGALQSTVRGRLVDSSGSVDGNVFTFEAAGDDEQVALQSLAPKEGGGFFMAWRLNADGDETLRVREYSASAVPAPTLTAVTTTQAFDPTITGLDDGGFLAVWEENPNEGLIRRRYAGDGTVGATVDLTTSSQSQSDPDAVALPDGRAAIVWYQVGSSQPGRIQLQIVAADDTVEAELTVHESFQTLGFPRVAYDAGRDELVVVWHRRSSDLEDVYLRRYSFGGVFIDGFETGDTSAWTPSP